MLCMVFCSPRRFSIGGDFNVHVGETTRGYDEVHRGFSYGVKNEDDASFSDFPKAFDVVLANPGFQKSKEHLVTFRNTHIDYLLHMRGDKGLCTKCKVMPSEFRLTHHRFLVMD